MANLFLCALEAYLLIYLLIPNALKRWYVQIFTPLRDNFSSLWIKLDKCLLLYWTIINESKPIIMKKRPAIHRYIHKITDKKCQQKTQSCCGKSMLHFCNYEIIGILQHDNKYDNNKKHFFKINTKYSNKS